MMTTLLVYTIWTFKIQIMKWVIWLYSYIQVKWIIKHYDTSNVTFLSLIAYDEWPYIIISYDTKDERDDVYMVALQSRLDFRAIAEEIDQDMNDPDEEMCGPKTIEAMADIRDENGVIFRMDVTSIYYQFAGPFRDFRYGLVDENIYAQYLMKQVIPPKYTGCTMSLTYKTLFDEKRQFGAV